MSNLNPIVHRKACTLLHTSSGTKFQVYLTEYELKNAEEDDKFAFDLVEKYYKLYSNNIIHAAREQKSSIILTKPTISVNNLEPSTSVSSQEQECDEHFDSLVNPIDENVEMFEEVRNYPTDEENVEMFEEVRNYLTEDDDDLLISLVSARPPLYDFRLPLKERTREQIRKLWEEVISGMNIRITVKQISSRWKSIRDSYLRARGNINKKLASGSSAAEKIKAENIKAKHKNYELLQFLEDTLTDRTTSSNVSVNDTEESMDSPTQSERTPVDRGKKRNSGQLDAADESFFKRMDILCASASESSRPLTATHHFCMRLAEGLEKLPRNIKNKLEIHFLQKLSEAEELHCNNTMAKS